MKKKSICLLAFLLFTQLIFSQSQLELFSSDGNNRLTKSELDSLAADMQIKYSKAFKKNVFVEINKKKSFLSGDTLVHLIGFGIIDERTKNLRAGNKLYGLQGKAFPDFEIKLIDETTLSNQDLKGKPSMINFWFAQCAPCIDEMPLLNKLKNQYSDQVNFVAITYENKTAIEKFLTKKPL